MSTSRDDEIQGNGEADTSQTYIDNSETYTDNSITNRFENRGFNELATSEIDGEQKTNARACDKPYYASLGDSLIENKDEIKIQPTEPVPITAMLQKKGIHGKWSKKAYQCEIDSKCNLCIADSQHFKNLIGSDSLPLRDCEVYRSYKTQEISIIYHRTYFNCADKEFLFRLPTKTGSDTHNGQEERWSIFWSKLVDCCCGISEVKGLLNQWKKCKTIPPEKILQILEKKLNFDAKMNNASLRQLSELVDNMDFDVIKPLQKLLDCDTLMTHDFEEWNQRVIAAIKLNIKWKSFLQKAKNCIDSIFNARKWAANTEEKIDPNEQNRRTISQYVLYQSQLKNIGLKMCDFQNEVFKELQEWLRLKKEFNDKEDEVSKKMQNFCIWGLRIFGAVLVLLGIFVCVAAPFMEIPLIGFGWLAWGSLVTQETAFGIVTAMGVGVLIGQNKINRSLFPMYALEQDRKEIEKLWDQFVKEEIENVKNTMGEVQNILHDTNKSVEREAIDTFLLSLPNRLQRRLSIIENMCKKCRDKITAAQKL